MTFWRLLTPGRNWDDFHDKKPNLEPFHPKHILRRFPGKCTRQISIILFILSRDMGENIKPITTLLAEGKEYKITILKNKYNL